MPQPPRKLCVACMHCSVVCPLQCCPAADPQHSVRAVGSWYLSRGRCPSSPPCQGAVGGSFGDCEKVRGRCQPSNSCLSHPIPCATDASCGRFRARRDDYARREARRRLRANPPRPRRCRRRHCRRCRRRRCLPEPRERPRRRQTGLGCNGRWVAGAAACRGRHREPPRRLPPGQA